MGGGCVLSLLGVWQAHGIDAILREAWEAGVVMCGVSAGSLCWFSEGVTAFHGAPRPYAGLGLLPWSNTVHYDAERCREGEYRRLLKRGHAPRATRPRTAPPCTSWATACSAVVSSRPEARAYRMRRLPHGRVARKALRDRLPGRRAPPPTPEPSLRMARRAGWRREDPAPHPGAGRRGLHQLRRGLAAGRADAGAGRTRDRPPDLPAAHRQRRPRGPDRALLRRIRAAGLRAVAHLAVPAGRRRPWTCAATCSRRT